jgi:CRP-like cAMP-binding protein
MPSARRPTVGPRPSDHQPTNRLLAALPSKEFRRVRRDLTTIPIRTKQVLHRQGEPLQHVYFLNGGVGSVTSLMADGTLVEAATVGDEGMLGIEAFFSNHPIARGETLIQVPDTSAERMTVAAFRRELARRGRFHDVIGGYADVLIGQMIQTAACNALHPVEQRCCRWLLMTHDRMREQDFHLSHEFLAVMLGVTRPTVTVVAGTLQQAGLIRYTHGRVTVVDRYALEQAACECYAAIRGHFDHLLRTFRTVG